MRSSLLISLIGISSLKGILRDLLGMDFLEEVLVTHWVTPRYSVISGRGLRMGNGCLDLAMFHWSSELWFQRLEAEFSRMDLVERSILGCSISWGRGWSLLKLFLCFDLCPILSTCMSVYLSFRFWCGCESAPSSCCFSYGPCWRGGYLFIFNYS